MDKKVTASLEDVSWMVGPWAGNLGSQTVKEDWIAEAGIMSTMVRLGSPTSVDMIELIAIREEADTLKLHLRQFGPALDLRHSDDMALAACGPDSVSFVSPGAAIEGLAYFRVGESGMRVEVTVTGGAVLAAELERP